MFVGTPRQLSNSVIHDCFDAGADFLNESIFCMSRKSFYHIKLKRVLQETDNILLQAVLDIEALCPPEEASTSNREQLTGIREDET